MSDFRARNWVFLGDSITEGVGSSRFSYVSELASMINDRAGKNDAAVFRLRWQSPDVLGRQVMFNCLANCSVSTGDAPGLWIWNLASEGQVIDTDFAWLPLLANLRPEKIFIMRGALESIMRPECYVSQQHPFWIPREWRGYAALDPRCYFSDTWWRRAKQRLVDGIKQKLRHHLLRTRPVRSLMAPDVFQAKLDQFCAAASQCTSQLVLLGLVPVSDETFPGSRGRFEMIDQIISQVARKYHASFVDMKQAMSRQTMQDSSEKLFYLDGFHPTLTGARQMAQNILNGIGGLS